MEMAVPELRWLRGDGGLLVGCSFFFDQRSGEKLNPL